MDFLGARIQLNPRPIPQTAVALEVALLGHCPGNVRLERLRALSAALDEMRRAGFGARVDAIINDTEIDLYDLPIPLASSAEFDDIFPNARTQATQYASVLAGDTAWLPFAVDDFFANGGEKLWIVRVREAEGVRGFLPAFNHPLHDTESLRGLSTLLVLNDVGLIGFPDLERLQIPAQLPGIPRKRLTNPEPQFLPVGTVVDDGHRERRSSQELENETAPWQTLPLLSELLALTTKNRPDIQCLFSLPLAYSAALESPNADPLVLAELNNARAQTGAYLLRQVQLVFPYLNNGDALTSAVGVVAGAIASSARRNGIWRSIGATKLISSGRPYPALNIQQTLALREAPGVGVINLRQGILQIDDERLMVPALHRDDYLPGQYSERLNGMRSAEVVRFLGYLMRELRKLGERMVFNIDPRDSRPKLLLQKFFTQLYKAGALRGATAADAFTITAAERGESTVAFNIEIAPAYPIDKIVLTFINLNGEWASSVNSSSKNGSVSNG